MDSSLPPPPVPVVLAWTQDTSPEDDSRIPFGTPPSYDSVRLRNVPVTYTFSRLSSDSMLLVPPPDLPDTRPLYHISVKANPLFAYTTICRGGNPDGEFVAELQSAEYNSSTPSASHTLTSWVGTSPLSSPPASYASHSTASSMSSEAMPGKQVSVFLGQKELAVDHVLKDLRLNSSKHQKCAWLWAGPKYQFKWDCLHKPYICHFNNGKEIYAKFSPTRPRGTRSEVYTLELRPSGYDMIDDILVSALLIEQKWLMEPSIV